MNICMPIFRLRTAFDLGVQRLKIDPLLEPEDIHTIKPDKKSILMYIMCLYHSFDSQQPHLPNASSAQMFDQHFENSSSYEEIQLLHERATGTSEAVIEEEGGGKGKGRGDANVKESRSESIRFDDMSDLDENSLAKSTDESGEFPTRSSSTSTMLQNELPAADEAGSAARNDAKGKDRPSAAFQSFAESHSRPLSTATNASVELGGYQNAIEVVLSLLLEAEEALSKHSPEIEDLREAKAKFQEHEEFMIKMSEYQEFVGSALEEGARLLQGSPTGLSGEDHNEIRQQMLLLNERWEILRMSALKVQTCVHKKLAEIQLRKIEELRALLTATEDRISRMGSIDPSHEAVQRQIKIHKDLEDSLNQQKLLVDNLSNLVVIVNDDLFSEMEDKLAALGERWTNVVKWTKGRFERLQQIQIEWKVLKRKYRILGEWLQARESELKHMETSLVTQIGSAMERINTLKFCAFDLSALYDHLLDLEESAQQFHGAATDLLALIENLKDRCEALKEIVEIQQQRIETLGLDFSIESVTDAVLPNDWTDYQSRLHNISTRKASTDAGYEAVADSESDSEDESPHSRKKLKMQKSPELQRLAHKVEEMIVFIAAGEQTLMRAESIESLDKQQEVLKQLLNALESKIVEYAEVKALMESCAIEQPDEDLKSVEDKISDVASKYDELNFRLEHLLKENDKHGTTAKVKRTLTGLKLVLADCHDWFNQNCTLQGALAEDLQSRLKYMDSLDFEIEEVEISCNRLKEHSIEALREDLQQFLQSWYDIKSAIRLILQEKFGIVSEEEESNVEAETLYKEVVAAAVDISGTDSMNANLEKLNELKQRIEDFRQSIGNVACEDVQTYSQTLDEKIIKQATAIDNMNHFLAEFTATHLTLSKMNATLSADHFLVGEKSVLENQLSSYEAHYKEIKKIETDIIGLRNFSKIIVREGDKEENVHSLEGQINCLNDLFTKTVDLFKCNDGQLRMAISRTNAMLAHISDFETWLNELEHSTPRTENAEVINSNELFQLRSKFQILKETCEQKTIPFRELNERGSEILLQIDEQSANPNKCSVLAKHFTKLNARWNEVTTLVYKRCGFLEHISNQLGEFKTLIVSENCQLDRLEKCLRKSPENAADVEEIYEDLDVSDIEIHSLREVNIVSLLSSGPREQYTKSF